MSIISMQSQVKKWIFTGKMHKITYSLKKQMAAILYLSLTKIVWNLKAHITSRLIYKHIWIEKPWPKCGYI